VTIGGSGDNFQDLTRSIKFGVEEVSGSRLGAHFDKQ
jgi:hypothetical protein